MSIPFISIVIPALNRAHLIRRTLDSVAAQSFRNFELIVVDNGSDDGTLATVNEWGASHDDVNLRTFTEPERGAARARNRGLRESLGEWAMFFDSDDTMDSGLLERIAAEAADADIVAWNVRIHQLDGTTVVRRSEKRDALFHTIFNGNFSTQRYAARTALFHSAGGWNGDLHGWDDIELGVRLLLTNPTISLLNIVMVDIYAQVQSITGKSHSTNPQKWETALDCISSDLSVRGSRRVLRWVDLRRAILAGQYSAEGNADEGVRLLREVLGRAGWRSWVYRFAYRHTSKGRRGAARLLRWFC